MNKMVIDDLEKIGRMLTYLEERKNSEKLESHCGRENLIKNLPAQPPLDYQTLKIWGEVNPDDYRK